MFRQLKNRNEYRYPEEGRWNGWKRGKRPLCLEVECGDHRHSSSSSKMDHGKEEAAMMVNGVGRKSSSMVKREYYDHEQ